MFINKKRSKTGYSSTVMFKNCPDWLTLPEYPFPSHLEMVLDVNEASELSRTSQMYAKILESLSTVKYVDLSEKHYVQLLKLALYLEEFKCHKEMKKRNLFKRKIQRCSSSENLFRIGVEDLDEERPWIRENDVVDVIDTHTLILYTLKVTCVKKNDIVINDESEGLTEAFKPWHFYDIKFHFQNYPLRCNHYALRLTDKEKTIAYLFPDKSKSFVKMDNEAYNDLTMFNPNIESNPEQRQAVSNILHKSSFPAPYILYGPPGTGKTATLVEAICQIHKVSPLGHILVCTPSNTAADELAKRLLKFIPARKIYRMYSQSKSRSADEELKECSTCGGATLTLGDLKGKAVLISTLCTATRFLLMRVHAGYFSHIIIDEAGQGTEPDILIPIGIASKNGTLHSQIVLAGDPQQLGPTVISTLANKILGRSILERIMSYDTYLKDDYNNYNPRYITKLLHNYRSHPSIIHISNKLFYDNELVAKFSDVDQKVQFPVIFHGVVGVEEKYSYSPSTYNYEEIRTVLKYVYDLMENKTEFGEVSGKDIGIVTPFKLQSKRIKKILQNKDKEEKRKLEKMALMNKAVLKEGRNKCTLKSNTANGIKKNDEKNERKSSDGNLENEENVLETEYKTAYPELDTKRTKLRKIKGKGIKSGSDNDDNEVERKRFKDINVGTVELFQGQERKIMIMTAVRSKTFFNDGREHIGFLSNPKRFNVAMTRAQNALIVIGNPDILQKDDMWQYLLKYCIDNESYHGVKFALRDSCDGKPDVTELQTIATSASLFKDKPFILFTMDGLYSRMDVVRTNNAFLESDKDGLENLLQLHKTFKDLNIY